MFNALLVKAGGWIAGALVVCAAVLIGCGGSGTKATTSTTSTTASKQVFQCLFLHGLKPVPDSTRFGGYDPNGKTAPGYENGLAIKVSGASKPVIVSFYGSSEDAATSERFESSIVKGTSGGTTARGNVVVFHGTSVPSSDLSKIEKCAFSA